MTSDLNSNATRKPISAGRARFPFLGVTALIAGAILPVWAILAVTAGGLEAAATATDPTDPPRVLSGRAE